MDESSKQAKEKQKVTKVKTFPVPLALGESKENITYTSQINTKLSKAEIVAQAFKYHSQGNISEASKYYQYLINQGFNDPRLFSNYGSILKDLGKLQEAKLYQLKAIQLNPFSAEAHYNLGNTLKDLGKLQEAKLYQLKAIQLNPDFTEAHSNLGLLFNEIGKLQEAKLYQLKAIQLNPNYAKAHSNLGLLLSEMGQLQEAELSTRKAIELNPNFAEAYSNLGSILNNLGQLKEAEISLRKAIKLKPDFADAYFNLTLIDLLKGDYQSGLENYEFRFKKKQPVIPHSKPKSKIVNNQQLQKGEKLLVISEQGIGDIFQYMRYIPYLRNQGFDISFCTLEKLHTLIQASAIDPNPYSPKEAKQISEGQWIPLLSLAKYLKVSPKNPIVTKPYIFSTHELNKKWQNLLSKEKRPIVGINWQGNPKMEKRHYQGRSIGLKEFAALTNKNKITMLSLQKGFGSEQLEDYSFQNQFVKCQPQINSTWDFLENAAIIQNCDLIITCDTSIAHLAGGMGKTVWLLLRDIPYWTWGLVGDTTFWYPSMRLFRQKKRHDWNEVMIRVTSALQEEIKLKYNS